MNPAHERIREVLALPLEQRREALLPMYEATYGAYNRDWDLNTASFADDYQFVAEGTARLPGLADSWHGRDGYLAAHAALLDIVDIERVEVDDVLPLADGRVAAFIRFVIHAGDGTFDQQFLDVHEFNEDGALIRQSVWFDREEGLRELGL